MTGVADGKVDAVAGLDHGARHLVAHDARIGEERVLALEDVVVGAADADMADRDQRPAGRRCAGCGAVFHDKVAGRAADDSFHAAIPVVQ